MLHKSIVLPLAVGFTLMLSLLLNLSLADPLSDKVAMLHTTAAAHNGLVQLDSYTFDNILSSPRNYSIAILFTAMSPEFQCVPCKNFDPEFKLVASTWLKIPEKSKLFFAVIDFKVGQPVFQRFEMVSAPSLLYFPFEASSHQHPDFDRYDFNSRGFLAESLASWLASKSGVPINIRRPFDYFAFTLQLLGLLALGIVVYAMYNRGVKVIRSKYLWAGLSLFTIFIMISGHMWNQIRNPPISMPGHDGQPGYIAAGFQTQFRLEALIVAVIYALLAGTVISLISVPTVQDPSKQRVIIWIWLGVYGLTFSVLLQLFRLKNPSYPYRFLF